MSRSPSFHARSQLDAKVDEEGFQQWVVAFCIIRFDLEQGQLIEECYPPGCLTQNEALEVAFSSFPDSISQHHNGSSIHDCIFFFRIRRQEKSHIANVVSHEIVEVDREIASLDDKVLKQSNNIQKSNRPKYLYGFVFNRQIHDDRLKRGGEQKSMVILSHNPYSIVFRPLLQIMGPLYFDIGKKALNYIAASVSSWPAPLTGQLMELYIGNATLKVHLPPAHSLPWSGAVFFEDLISPIAHFLPSNQSVPQGLFHDSKIFLGYFEGF
ncbi:hypothetical protein ACH5RR_008638 [Cinchona calisaya]|uniref:UDENN domain-containing protein n=1 Tax=Cinchona calisaya TaxID=153742 RepID=A0ABD3AEF7_9GENT